MPRPSAPIKTPAGHDELRHRTHRLSQRHRTLLLLVDGQRSLSEVLDLAQKAGAQSSHLDALVDLGLVELPGEPNAGPADPADVTAAAAGEVFDMAAPATSSEAAAKPAAVNAPVVSVPPMASAEGEPEVVAALPDRQVSAAAEEPLATDLPPPPNFRAEHVDGETLAALEPLHGDERMLDEVRRLLLDTLRHDTLLVRAFAPARVRAAGTHDELIALVWEIERERAHARRKQTQLLKLQRARELLGMGNTLVAGDSLPPPVP